MAGSAGLGACESAVLDYFGAVESGRIVACEKMQKTAAIVLSDMTAKGGRWRFNEKEAHRHVSFIETFCKLPAGNLGAPFTLEPFQRAQIAYVFGMVDEHGERKIQEVLEIEGRKNGKTSKAAAISIDLLVNDREGAPHVYFAATKKDQADIGFNAAMRMIRKSLMLKNEIRKRVSDLYFAQNMGIIKSLASNTGTLDGLDVSGAIIDELSAHRNRDVYDLIKQGMAARSKPLLWVITTNGFVRECIFDDQYRYAANWLDGKIDNERFIPFIYELDDKTEWTDEECWVKANPGIDTIKSRDYLRGNVQKAKDDPAFLPTVLTKDFNMKENASNLWLTWDEIENPMRYEFGDMGFVYGIGGIDAADSVDLSAACVLCMRPGDDHIYKRSMYWLPETVLDEQTTDGNRRERDIVPYGEWVRRGYMRTAPGNKVDKRVFLEWFQELQEEYGLYFSAIGYDPWHIDDTNKHNFEQWLGPGNFVSIRQGPYTLSQPMKSLKVDYKAHRIVDDMNPVDIWCRSNVAIKVDANANIQPDKGKGAIGRIDGFAAELDAYCVLVDRYDEYQSMIQQD